MTFNAGDDVTIPADATVQAATDVLINVDGAAGTDQDVATTTGGSRVTLAGTVTVGNVAVNRLTIRGGLDNDAFLVRPQAGARIDVVGAAPAFGDPGVPPGDCAECGHHGA